MPDVIKMGIIHDSGWMRIENKKDNVVTIDLEGVIGGSFWEDDEEQKANTRAKMSAELKALAALKPSKIILNINSPGGDVGHGLSIHDMLVQHSAEIETRVIGLTASIATVIAQAGNTRKISANSLYLVHLPMMGMLGMFNELELENMQESLKAVSKTMKGVYTKRGVSDKVLEDIIQEDNGNGKWQTAEEAMQNGFVDEVYEPMQMAAIVLDKNIQMNMRLPDLPKAADKGTGADTEENTQILNIMKKELTDLFANLKGWFTENFKKEGSEEIEIPEAAQAKLTELETKITEVGDQEDKITTLEASVESITGERDTATAEVTAKTGELETANATIKTLESDLAKAKAKSTKPEGKPGSEDVENLGGDTLQAQLSADLAKIKGE